MGILKMIDFVYLVKYVKPPFGCSDRSTEEAEVIFERRDDAVAALKQYNNLALDNKPMQITLIEDEGTAAGGRTLSSGIR